MLNKKKFGDRQEILEMEQEDNVNAMKRRNLRQVEMLEMGRGDNGEAINMNMRTTGNTSDRSSRLLRRKQSLPNATQLTIPMQEILTSSFALIFMESSQQFFFTRLFS